MTDVNLDEMTELLVPLDGRGATMRRLPLVGRIAGRLGLPVRLMTVAENHEEAMAWLEAEAVPLLSGTDATTTVVSGDPAEGIIAEAGESSVVCISTAATLLPHQGHVGSVAEAVVRGLGLPVLLLGPDIETDPAPIERVVAPVDGSELSEAILDIAAQIAVALDVELWVVSVVPFGAERAVGARLGVDAMAASTGYVRRVAGQLASTHGVRIGYEVLHIEDPAEAILDFAGDDAAVVMSTHGRSGTSRLFAGSVARQVVASARRPVVVYRPSEELDG